MIYTCRHLAVQIAKKNEILKRLNPNLSRGEMIRLYYMYGLLRLCPSASVSQARHKRSRSRTFGETRDLRPASRNDLRFFTSFSFGPTLYFYLRETRHQVKYLQGFSLTFWPFPRNQEEILHYYVSFFVQTNT